MPDPRHCSAPPKRPLLWACVAIGLSVSGAVDAQPHPVVPQPRPDFTETYKGVDGVDLKLHVFGHDEASASGRSVPVVLWIHGGGWLNGSPGQFFRQSAHFAKRGMISISATYRVQEKHGATPYDAIRDVFDAMRYVRRHAAAWGGDPDRIAAGGSSAGGHLAAALATLTAEDLAGTPEEAAAARPDLLLLISPVFDNGPDRGYGHERLGERWRDASPAHHLHARVPPTIVLLGERDRLIPVDVAERVGETLRALGVTYRLVVYPGIGHSFANYGNFDAKYYHKVLGEMDRFFVAHGWLDPPDRE